MSRHERILWFGIIFMVLFAHGVYLERIQGRVDRLEKVCHGQCQFGDHGCKERCDKDGHCPMGDR